MNDRFEDLRPWLAAFAALTLSSPWAGLAASIPQQAYLKASNNHDPGCYGCGYLFGVSVAVSGDTAVVGAMGEPAAYFFLRNGTNWTEQTYFTGPGLFGISVAVSGDTAVVGTTAEASYVFLRSGTNWSQQTLVKASNTDPGDGFGRSVAMSGDTVVVGAPYEASRATGVNGEQNDNSAFQSGAAYVFVRDGTNWSQQAYLKASNTGSNDIFGSSVAVSGDTVVVGSTYESSDAIGVNGDQSDHSAALAGAAYVFVRNGINWSQQAYLKASNTDVGDGFGGSVAVSGDTVVVGAAGEDSNATGVNGNQSDNSATNSGAAYVFVRNGSNWTQQAYLKASNTRAGDAFTGANAGFGGSVAVSGDTIVIGAGGEASNATGVNGNQTNNNAAASGAAYVFVRSGTNWGQQAYVKASNTDAGDYFGSAVALSGGTMVAGAWGEDSNAAGVNSDQTDNNGSYNGAAYVLAGLGIGPTLALAPDGSGGYLIRLNGVPGAAYHLQRAPSVTGPWDILGTQPAPASGLIEFHETNLLSGQGFYRTVQP